MPPQIDGDHRGPLINLAAWVTLVPVILFVIAKVLTKWRMAKALQLDDGYMIFGTLVAIGQTINTAYQVKSGIGQHESGLTENQFDIYQKTTYISQLFYLITIAFAKMASLQFLVTLTWATEAILVVKAVLGFVVIWLFVSVFCVAFQCELPSPWNQATGKCFSQPAFWTANTAVDIVTQLLIALIPIYLLFNLHMASNRKRLAMFAFTPNLTTIPLSTIRIIYIYKSTAITTITTNTTTPPTYKTDLPYTTFLPALISQIHANYSIIASCMPFMRRLVESLAIGIMTNEIRVSVDPASLGSGSGGGGGGGVKSFGVVGNPFALLGGRGVDGGGSGRNVYGWERRRGESRSRSGSTVDGGQGKGKVGRRSGGEREGIAEAEGLELRVRGLRGVNDGSDGINGFGSRERMVTNQIRTTQVSSEVAV